MTDPDRSRAPDPSRRIAVLVSGSGTNLLALADAAERGVLHADLAVVVSDVADAPALDRARERGLTAVAVPFDRADRPGWEERLADAVAAHHVGLVVLAGFMRILSPAFLDRWPGRVVNVHPSLLPAFPGADAVGDALAAGVATTGVTVHLVDELVDHGPVLAQEAVPVHADDTRATLLARLHTVEHRLLPEVVARLLDAPSPDPGGSATPTP